MSLENEAGNEKQQAWPSRRLNNPSVSSPEVFGKPLYTTGLGRNLLRTGAIVAFTGYEGFRFARDAGAAFTLARKATARETRLIEDGYGVELFLPATMHLSEGEFPTVRERISGATSSLVEDGKLSIQRKLPVPVKRLVMGKTGNTRTELTFGVPGGETSLAMANFLLRGLPVARMTIVPDALEITTRNMVSRGDKETQELTSGRIQKRSFIEKVTGRNTGVKDAPPVQLLPRLNVKLQLFWISSKSGDIVFSDFNFPMGYSPLEFDENGEVKGSPYAISGHPALLGLEDFANTVSASILAQTRGKVTVDGRYVMDALGLAKSMGGSIESVVGPHFNRFLAVDLMSSSIAQVPGETVMAVFNSMTFTDIEGELLDPSVLAELMNDFTERVLGFDHDNSQTCGPWVSYVKTLHEVCREKEILALDISSNSFAGDIVYQSGKMRALKTIAERMSKDRATIISEIIENSGKPLPVPPAILMSRTLTPIKLLLNVQAQISSQQVDVVNQIEANKRQINTANAIVEMDRETTKQVEEFNRAMVEGHHAALKKLPKLGSELGKESAESEIASRTGN